jgi:hypothetical protein
MNRTPQFEWCSGDASRNQFRIRQRIVQLVLPLALALSWGELQATGAVKHLITLDETTSGSKAQLPTGPNPAVILGNVWLMEPGTALGPAGTVSDLAHFSKDPVTGDTVVIFISDQDGPNAFDDPADQLGFGGNVPAAGDIFLAEVPLGLLGLDTGADWSPGTGQPGDGADPVGQFYTYRFISNCSCNEPEPSSFVLLCIGLVAIGAIKSNRVVASITRTLGHTR